MNDYQQFLKANDLYRKAGKLREQGKYEQAWQLEGLAVQVICIFA